MQRVKLDAIDRKILAELQADGRMTNVELSNRVGISAPPCLRRVRALEEAGLIEGYHAQLSERDLGFDVTVFAMVGLHSQAEADLRTHQKRFAAVARRNCLLGWLNSHAAPPNRANNKSLPHADKYFDVFFAAKYEI